MKRIEIVSAPSKAPLTLETVKGALRIDEADTVEDGYLLNVLIPGVVELAEAYANRSFIERTLKLILDSPFSGRGIHPFREDQSSIILPGGPVSSITSVVTVDEDGSSTTEDSGIYYLAGDTLVFTATLAGSRREKSSLEITYVTGYASTPEHADIPSAAIVALLKALATAYENREDFVIGKTVAHLPSSSLDLLDTVKCLTPLFV